MSTGEIAKKASPFFLTLNGYRGVSSSPLKIGPALRSISSLGFLFTTEKFKEYMNIVFI